MAEVFSLRLPTAQGAGLKKFLVSGLIRVTRVIWPVFGYYLQSVATAFVWIMFCIAKAKKIGSNMFLWLNVREETLWRLIWIYY
jgi:hypothetical protein